MRLSVLVAAFIFAVPSASARLDRPRSCPPTAAGTVAYLHGSELHALDLAACRDRLLASDAATPVRFSPDGRFVAFGSGAVVSIQGGAVTPARFTGRQWRWAGRGHFLAPRPPAARWDATRSPDGRWLFYWAGSHGSNSIAADGLPLYVRRVGRAASGSRVVPKMLAAPDFLSWCGQQLVVAAGGDRYTTDAKQLLLIAPRWRAGKLTHDARSWVSPACSPDGRTVAASAGRSWVEPRFGLERRSIWLIRLDGSGRKRLTSPPPGRTDESPRWSADGRFVLFVRAGPTARGATAPGSLWLVRVGDGRLFGPLARAGRVANYYGHYGWADAVDWR